MNNFFLNRFEFVTKKITKQLLQICLINLSNYIKKK